MCDDIYISTHKEFSPANTKFFEKIFPENLNSEIDIRPFRKAQDDFFYVFIFSLFIL